MFWALDGLRPADVCMANASPCYALSGGLMSMQAAALGVAADGFHRDKSEINALGFPVLRDGSEVGMGGFDSRLLLLDGDDNVLVLGAPVAAGEAMLIDGVAVLVGTSVGRGHKVARRAIGLDEQIIKYGAPIGRATAPIARGEHVHVHNIRSDYTATYVIG